MGRAVVVWGSLHLLCSLVLGACSRSSEPQGTPPSSRRSAGVGRKLEANKALVRRVTREGINAQKLEVLSQLLAEDYARHSQSSPPAFREIRGKGPFLRMARAHFSAFPDWNEKVEFMIAEGDKVAYVTTGTGTHKGRMGPFDPTGKRVRLQHLVIHRIKKGKISETWILWDNVAFLQQLGLLPPIAPPQRGK